ncbi:single-stranded DNA-binding protein [Paenibacillus sp. FSL R7-0204]|uniref:single-stranded DNA-binding protein n=1 Tax=unclassified Paenibacillus TaxID=185978 RepID=UPI0003E243EA|nr:MULTISPECIES: single-stranded DNA-binding protein [unclassified Paenibacillus]ETT39614.1 single-stranded DNA-binding protein [Paenibacillus sp. FSL R7-269]OMF87674.1 single-stranded DNA-binding protein [Paenibacillus sp. FSL R7-0337]
MLNRIILIGRLTRDPELRYTPAGVAVTQFTLAVDRNFTGQNGEREADFIPVVTWRQLAETCANYLRKGRLAAVEGRIQVRNYENNEGKRVYVTEVIADNVRFLESAQSREGGNASSGGSMPEEPAFGGGGNGGNSARGNGSNNNFSRNNNTQDPFSGDGKPIDISDDDLPF